MERYTASSVVAPERAWRLPFRTPTNRVAYLPARSDGRSTLSLLDTNPASSHAILLTLRYGSGPTIKRYCRWTSNIILSGGSETFFSTPTLEVDFGKQDGSTQDNPTKFRISSEHEPFDRLVQPFSHALVSVTIEEINPYDVASRNVVYKGRVGFAKKNPSGRRGNIVEVSCVGVKARLANLILSLPMLTKCDNPFRGRLCRVDASAWDRSGTVVSAGSPQRNSVVLNISGISDPLTELANNRYGNGSVSVNGHSIIIRRSHADGSFELAKIPPPWWVGEDCLLFPGCNKQLQSCRVWENEQYFNGRGFKIPSRNPVYELPST
jgi:hypothetical protein